MARSREVVGVKFWQKVFWARVFATHQVEKTLFPLCAGPPKSDPGSQIGLLVAVKGRERSTIPSIYAQRLLMGHVNIDATDRRTGKHQNVQEE